MGAGKQLRLGVCLPLWGCPGPSPLTGGGPCRVLGPRALGVVRRGFLPFLPDVGRVCSPDPGPGLVARPPPFFCLLPDALLAIKRHLSKSISVPLGGGNLFPPPLALLVGGGGKGAPFCPLPSPLSLPSSSPSGVSGSVAREILRGVPWRGWTSKSLCPGHLPGSFSRG